MCGITGIFLEKQNRSESELQNIVSEMNRRIKHRGPDGDGTWVTGKVALGHVRLAVIDLSEQGAQPMVGHGRHENVLTFNGEIYNHQSLRAELEEHGYNFKSQCDTEVILHGYAEWGAAVVEKLRGMFAFAIFDPKEGSLFLARDRMGQKPLFYCQTPDGFVFASEIKSLLSCPNVSRQPDFESIHHYLTLGYTFGESTGFKNIFRVPPAHTLRVSAQNELILKRYWSVPEIETGQKSTQADLKNELMLRLQEAVDIRKIADVPVGAFLSGGVDSSTICALMGPNDTQKLQTFSVGFDREGYDETDVAQRVAAHLKTQHHSFIMDDGLLAHLCPLVWHFDMPFADSSSLVTYALSKEIKKNVTVSLSGDGADELLLGYTRYGKLSDIYEENGPQDTPLNRRRLSSFPARAPKLLDAYIHAIEKFREKHKAEGYEYKLLPFLKTPMLNHYEKFFDLSHGPQIAAAQMDLKNYLCDDILVKMDIASMAHGLEVRSPFMDHHLVEWISRLPQKDRTFMKAPKALLKEAVQPLLPKGVTERAKMGFRVPVGIWLRHHLGGLVQQLLKNDRFHDRGLFRPEFVNGLVDQHVQEQEEHGSRLWSLVMLELWFRTFIDDDGAAPLTPQSMG